MTNIKIYYSFHEKCFWNSVIFYVAGACGKLEKAESVLDSQNWLFKKTQQKKPSASVLISAVEFGNI